MVTTHKLPYDNGSGTSVGLLAIPDSPGPHPAVLVVHEAPGLGEHPQRRTRMLAELGYVALGADLYGDGYVAPSHDDALKAVGGLLEGSLLLPRVRASFDALLDVPEVDSRRTAAIGYCVGGMGALELARSGAPLSAVVSFHGSLGTETPAAEGSITASVLVCTGAEDPYIPTEAVNAFQEEMRRAGADWQTITYSGAQHAFTDDTVDAVGAEGLAYHPVADRRSWAAMRSLFEETLVGS